MKAAILHGEVSPDANKDEQDVLIQVECVSRALTDLRYQPVAVPLSLDLKKAAGVLNDLRPTIVFNLVESVEGLGQWIHLGPTLCEFLKLPYSGSRKDAVYVTSNKLLAKQFLKSSGIDTPAFAISKEIKDHRIPFSPPFIVKSVWEHASIGLDENSIIKEKSKLKIALESRVKKLGGEWYAEQYITGREFNLSLLASKDGPQVLPPAEIRFIDYPQDKPKLVDYNAKWEEESFEFLHTIRSYDFAPEDAPLLNSMKEIAVRCWRLFDLRGYARVDFRVDEDGRPWVLEVNINPCISPDTGFVAAADQVGVSYTDIIARIVADTVS